MSDDTSGGNPPKQTDETIKVYETKIDELAKELKDIKAKYTKMCLDQKVKDTEDAKTDGNDEEDSFEKLMDECIARVQKKRSTKGEEQ